MKKLVFNCRVITPMFIAGNHKEDARNNPPEPEMRAASVKGALRFWWRATISDKNLNDLEKKESLLFGGSRTYQTRSKLNLKTVVTSEQFANAGDIRQDNPQRYLFYSVAMQKRKYYKQLNFEVTMNAIDEKTLFESAKAFWLLTNLGGLGSRSRRTGGSFGAKLSENNSNINFDEIFTCTATTTNEYQSYIRKGIEFFKISYDWQNNRSEYARMDNCRIHICDSEKSADKAMNHLGTALINSRRKTRPDYDTVKTFITKGRINQSVERTAFGLPLSFRYRSLQGGNANIEGSDKNRQRSGSRLIMSVAEGKNCYFPVMTFFNSNLTYKNEDIKIRSRESGTKYFAPPADTAVNNFIKSLNTVRI